MGGADHSREPQVDEIRVPWSRTERPVPRRILRPLQAFLETEVAGGILLLAAAVVALAWANSPWGETYEGLWRTPVGLRLGPWGIELDLRHWVNDGLMTLFFLVVGLEIKRELLTGELSDPRAAALPILAALGGMVVPALIYLGFNLGREGGHGWGIPMATDIAFAVGVLTLAARRAPASLKPFLLTLAIADDIGAIVVIAVFYTGGLALPGLLAAVALAGLVLLARRVGIRHPAVYVGLGAGFWVATFASGVHPTIAGVALGMLTPAEPFQRPRAVSAEAHRVADLTTDRPERPDADAPQWLYLAGLAREAVSPLARVEALLHPWTSYAIVPVFALANAGVTLSGAAVREAAGNPVAAGVFLGLVLGKTVGISVASALAVRAGVARLPRGAGWRDLVGAAMVGGIGFTVALFVTELAFEPRVLVDAAKVGILAASVVAGVLGWVVLWAGRPSEAEGEAAVVEAAATEVS